MPNDIRKNVRITIGINTKYPCYTIDNRRNLSTGESTIRIKLVIANTLNNPERIGGEYGFIARIGESRRIHFNAHLAHRTSLHIRSLHDS